MEQVEPAPRNTYIPNTYTTPEGFVRACRDVPYVSDMINRHHIETGSRYFNTDVIDGFSNEDRYGAVYVPNDEALVVALSDEQGRLEPRQYVLRMFLYTDGAPSIELLTFNTHIEIIDCMKKLQNAAREHDNAQEPWHLADELPEAAETITSFIERHTDY